MEIKFRPEELELLKAIYQHRELPQSAGICASLLCKKLICYTDNSWHATRKGKELVKLFG